MPRALDFLSLAMWEPSGILLERATRQRLDHGKIILAAEKVLDGKGRDNRNGKQIKNSYNGIVEKRGEAELGCGSTVERHDVDSRDINEIESIGPGDQLHLNQLYLSSGEIEKGSSAVASSGNFIFSWFICMRLRYIKCLKTDTRASSNSDNCGIIFLSAYMRI